jgi:hypothetical protein
MRKYRIKIEENSIGVRSYTPQVKKGFFKRLVNILDDSLLNSFTTSSTTRRIYNTEDSALKIINGYKEYVSKVEARKIKKIKYKRV